MIFEELREKLQNSNLASFANDILAESKEAIRARHQVLDVDNLPIGSSKIGGCPDLPSDFRWPIGTYVQTSNEKLAFGRVDNRTKYVQKPLIFIAQFDLEFIFKQVGKSLLPTTGFLFFFYNKEEQPWGYQYSDKDSFKVVYLDLDSSLLVRRALPYKPNYLEKLPILSLVFEKEVSVPAFEREVYSGIKRTPLFGELLDILNLERPVIHKLLGHADNIQHEMEILCEEVTKGAAFDKELTIQNKEHLNWQLLLQLDSIDRPQSDFVWGAFGKLYFWIKLDDLANRDFSKCWIKLQCT